MKMEIMNNVQAVPTVAALGMFMKYGRKKGTTDICTNSRLGRLLRLVVTRAAALG